MDRYTGGITFEIINIMELLHPQFDVKRLNLSSTQLYDSSCDKYIIE